MLSSRSLILAFIGGAITVLIVLSVYFRFIAPPRAFPQLADGSFLGVIQWEDLRGEELPSAFFLEKDGSQFHLSFSSPEREGLTGSFIELEDGAPGFAPVQLQSDSGSYLLFVKSVKDFSNAGKVLEVRSGRQGDWSLFTMPEGQGRAANEESENKGDALHLSLLLEEQYVSTLLERNQIAVQEIVRESKELEVKLTEVDKLKAEGKQRLESVQGELASLLNAKEEKLKEIGRLAQQLQLARKVTKYGEVVRLSRKAQTLDEVNYLQTEQFLNLEVPTFDE